VTNTAVRLLREAVRAIGSAVDGDDDTTRIAIADAALRQFELFGLARSTIEDIARRARVGRVTVYRYFPGKDVLIEAVALRELRKFLADLDQLIAPVEDPEETIVEGFVFTLHAVRSHRLMQRMIESEPEMALPWFTVQGAPIIAEATDFLAAHMALDADENRSAPELLATAEIVVRLIVSFLLTPRVIIDLDDDEQARAFARRYLVPMLATPDVNPRKARRPSPT
jgi:AcrR family transcriptional regulator